MKPATVIAVVNQKGGVGKTTTAVNLAASVAAAERRTLLVDLDPQGNASSGVGVSPRTVENSVYDALIGRASLLDVMQPTADGKLQHGWGYTNMVEMLTQTGVIKPMGADMGGKPGGSAPPAPPPAPSGKGK